MPPRRTSAAKGFTIGFYGRGETAKENAEKLLVDFIEAAEPATPKFVFAADGDGLSANTKALLDYAQDQEIPYEMVYDADAAAIKAVKSYVDGAAKSYKVTATVAKFLSVLESSDKPVLFILWDDEPDTSKLLENATGKQIECRDLTGGLDRLEFTPDEEEAAAADEPAAGDEDGHTKESLAEMSLTEVKAIAGAFGVETPRGRPRDEIEDAILEAQANPPDDDEDETAPAIEEDAEEAATDPALSDTETEKVLGASDPTDLDDLIAHYEGLLSHLRALQKSLQATSHRSGRSKPAGAEEPAEAPKRRRRAAAAPADEEPAPSTGVRRGRRAAN